MSMRDKGNEVPAFLVSNLFGTLKNINTKKYRHLSASIMIFLTFNQPLFALEKLSQFLLFYKINCRINQLMFHIILYESFTLIN